MHTVQSLRKTKNYQPLGKVLQNFVFKKVVVNVSHYLCSYHKPGYDSNQLPREGAPVTGLRSCCMWVSTVLHLLQQRKSRMEKTDDPSDKKQEFKLLSIWN